MPSIDIPFHIDGRGRTAGAADDDHVEQLLKLFLFTNPGERVNRPDFGGAARGLVFQGCSPELVAALKFNLLSNLQRWCADLVEVIDLTILAEDTILRIELKYVCRRTRRERQVQVQRPV